MLFSLEQVELASLSKIVVDSNRMNWTPMGQTDTSSIIVVDIESMASATLAAVLMYGCVYRNITMKIHWKNRLGYCRERLQCVNIVPLNVFDLHCFEGKELPLVLSKIVSLGQQNTTTCTDA